jgi:hypothetical protein
MKYTPLVPRHTPEEQARRAAEARRGTNRLKGVGHPTTSDPDYSEAEIELALAMDLYKRRTGHKFPTWQEVHQVLVSLGYKKAQ